ncbi:MAG TPA: hypothetical protein VHF47_11405 [Acidimicrobiales bacterium]|nr:hypothetical protein [Acidimicrobiales bacterium]
MTRKLSISLPDDLFDELQVEGADNVSAFVAGAIRQQLDRRRLLGFVAELEDELGAVDESAFTELDAILGDVLAAASTASGSSGRTGKSAKKPTAGRATRARSATP